MLLSVLLALCACVCAKDSSETSNSGFLEVSASESRTFHAGRRADVVDRVDPRVVGMVVTAETGKHRNHHERSSTESSDSSSSTEKVLGEPESSSSSEFSSSNGRNNKVDRQIEELIKNRLKANINPATIIRRQAYQARFSRNSTMGINTVADPAVNRTIGPVLILAKTTLADVRSDSFDGNNDGKLDVLNAFNVWATANTSQTAETDLFMRTIRNRATVNGGSIGLKALVLSGRRVNKNSKGVVTLGAFSTFSANTILITPCFPITNEKDYNIVAFAGGLKQNITLLGTASPILATDVFVNGQFIQNNVGPYNLTRLAGPSTPANEVGVIEGTFVLQPCTQFSYFQ